MKPIHIKIDDSLNPKEEIIEISKRLNQKLLSGGALNKEVLQIGENISIKEKYQTIIVERVSKEKPIEFIPCNWCGFEAQSNEFVSYYHNYGGSPRKASVCSIKCRDEVLENLGGRAALTRFKLKPLKHFA